MEASTDWNTVYILRQKKLRLTDSRKEILKVLQRATSSVGLAELERELPDIDRITMYRTLQSFRQKEIIHMVNDPPTGMPRYIFSRPELGKRHAHFKCKQCGVLVCLAGELPADGFLALPQGYDVQGYSLVVEGLCNRCNA
jgi:Fur family transcriptional regulator, ferric uptake regulator